MGRQITLTFTLLALAGGPAAAYDQQQGPTFDCAKASGQVETLICKDPALAALDRKMAEVYAAAMKKWPANVASEQRAYQRGWIRGRNDCWKEDDLRACAELSYRTRIVELQIKSGQLTVPAAVGYACTGGEDKPFFATFYKETDPPSAIITYGSDQVIAFAAPSASGAKYSAANMEFWEHQGEASVDWFGTKLTCRPKSAPAARPPLGGTSWVLVQFQSMDDTMLKPEADARYSLTFDDDGRLQVQADCNRGQGTWHSPDNVSLELGSVSLTRAQCRPSPLQNRFVRDLGFVRSYVVKEGQLHLGLMADGGIYSFDQVKPMPAR
ncbi:MAG TPA: MliC family protein [Vicinamibacterales bacterium]|nr:MliC family protein [Vicinamibacterales bacterium]